MRSPLAACLLFALTACSSGDDKKADAKKEEKKPAGPALKVGDPAPKFAASRWFNGGPVAVEPGKVYVLDFWATWCGPCIAVMPHLAELQREYKADGLVVVPVTTADGDNPVKRIEEFVQNRGKKLGVPFAVCETRETDDAYMKAAGQEGIPCSFVIDKQGKVAFIGHPMELDDVLPLVLAGTWKGQADVEAVQRMQKEFEAILDKAEDKPAEGLQDLAAFEAKHPAKAKQSMFQAAKVMLLLNAKKYDEAKAVTEAVMPKLIEKKSTEMLNQLRLMWTDPKLNPEKKHTALAVAAAEAVVKIDGDKDPQALLGLADVHFEAGDKAKAVELTEKAVGLANEPGLKKHLEQQLKKFKGEAKK